MVVFWHAVMLCGTQVAQVRGVRGLVVFCGELVRPRGGCFSLCLEHKLQADMHRSLPAWRRTHRGERERATTRCVVHVI